MSFNIHVADSSFDDISGHLRAAMDEVMSRNLLRLVTSDAWEPEINLYEGGDGYFICVNLAGMRAEDIELSMDGGSLALSGNRPRPKPPEIDEDLDVLIMEIDSGRFQRRISLPSDVDDSRICATYRQGFLWIRLPKRAG